jgi:hypothetical protein
LILVISRCRQRRANQNSEENYQPKPRLLAHSPPMLSPRERSAIAFLR